MTKVNFTKENRDKCLCAKCPVQGTSACIKEKIKNLRENPKPEDFPGLYCASGYANCEDINHGEKCICAECPIWKEYNLKKASPAGRYCRDGEAE